MAQYIYGKNVVCERVRSNKPIEKVMLVKGFKDENVINLLNENKIAFSYINKDEADKYSSFGNHQGILAKIKTYEFASYPQVLSKLKELESSITLILDGIEDPHNLGAIIRTADATGVDAIFVPKFGSAPLSEVVAKVSTGAIEYVPVCQVTNLNQLIEDLKQNGYWVVGAEEDNSSDYRKVDYKGKIALVVGSEGKGIAKLTLKNCDFKVKIPMEGHVNSLNASVSASIIMYEILRKKSGK